MQRLTLQKKWMLVPDPALARVVSVAARAAKSKAPVLICGESGTGKELIARYIHEQSARSQGPFVSVNCAAIPEGLLESELFGHERGAFTGAVAQRMGKFERANGGTLLLDEVSEMPIYLQAKLLRVLQEEEIDRLGGTQPVPIHVRIISTTNREPAELWKGDSFRRDLFFRLNVIRIECVPLRGRAEAILALANEFLLRESQKQTRALQHFTPEAVEFLRAYSWPGNVRELQNLVERASLLSDDEAISLEHFDTIYAEDEAAAPATAPVALNEVEESHILRVLGQTGGNRAEAARRLGISVRTLRNKLKIVDARDEE